MVVLQSRGTFFFLVEISGSQDLRVDLILLNTKQENRHFFMTLRAQKNHLLKGLRLLCNFQCWGPLQDMVPAASDSVPICPSIHPHPAPHLFPPPRGHGSSSSRPSPSTRSSPSSSWPAPVLSLAPSSLLPQVLKHSLSLAFS